MAEDPKAAEEEETAPPEKQEGKERREKPVSLFPLSFEEAVDALLEVKMEPERKKPSG